MGFRRQHILPIDFHQILPILNDLLIFVSYFFFVREKRKEKREKVPQATRNRMQHGKYKELSGERQYVLQLGLVFLFCEVRTAGLEITWSERERKRKRREKREGKKKKRKVKNQKSKNQKQTQNKQN